MIYRDFIHCFAILFWCRNFSTGTAVNRSIRDVRNETANCVALNFSNWTIMNLATEPLATWPWDCLNLRFTNVTLSEAIFNASSNVHKAACKGYLGFVQYYTEQRGSQLNVSNETGETPLHVAVANGHTLVVEYIATRIPARDLNAYNYKLITPLIYAAYFGQLNITKYLLGEMNVDASYAESDRKIVLNMAARSGNLPLLRYVVEERNYTINPNDTSLLLSSALGGNVDLIKYLIFEKNLTKTGTEPNSGDTALHKAASRCHLDAVKFFINVLHYDVDVQNFNDATPTHVATEGGFLHVLQYLVERKKADLNARNSYGDTLLHIAAHYGRLAVVKYLADRKRMSTELKDYLWRTPIHRAAQENKFNVLKYLAQQKKANLSATDHLGRNLLHYAVNSGNVVMIRYLIDDKKMIAMIDCVDNLNRTAAFEAAYLGHLAILKFLIGERLANATMVDADGQNLLHIAARENKLSVVKYLLGEKIFGVYSMSSAGKNAYDFATEYERNDNSDLLEYLRKKMDEDWYSSI